MIGVFPFSPYLGGVWPAARLAAAAPSSFCFLSTSTHRLSLLSPSSHQRRMGTTLTEWCLCFSSRENGDGKVRFLILFVSFNLDLFEEKNSISLLLHSLSLLLSLSLSSPRHRHNKKRLPFSNALSKHTAYKKQKPVGKGRREKMKMKKATETSPLFHILLLPPLHRLLPRLPKGQKL